MGSRFSRLNQAERLMAAKTELDKWQKMTGEERSALYKTTLSNTGNKKTNRTSVEGYLIPFGPTLSDNIWVSTKVLAATAENLDSSTEEAPGTLLTNLNEAIFTVPLFRRDTPPAGASIAGYVSPSKLARVTLVEIGAKNPNGIVSRLTKQKYTYHKRDSLSAPFGQRSGGTPQQKFEEVASNIKELLKTKSPSYRIYFKNQQHTGVTKIATP